MADYKAYILRTCAADMISRDGLQWPREGHVEAPDWEPTEECGNGLYGLLWGEGDGSLLDWSDDAVWVVAGIDEWVDLGDKVKFPSADVVFAGGRKEATDLIVSLGAKGAVVGASVIAGDSGTATAGYRGTATAGDNGTATAGESGTATAGSGGVIHIEFWDSLTKRYRIVTGYVGENGIRPKTPYHIIDGKLVEVGQ